MTSDNIGIVDVEPIRYCDRSRIVTDWTCPRKRFWNYEFDGKGIVKDGINQALHTGSIIHDSLAAIATYYEQKVGVDIDLIALTAAGQMRLSLMEAMEGEPNAEAYSNEQACLVEGLLRGYHKHVWPRLIQMYPEVIAIEKECSLVLDDTLTFMAKPDLILASEDGEWHYIEYKSTSNKKNEWIQSWNTAVQLHSSVKAVEETLGKAPVDVTVLGLYKGYFSYGRQNSPIVYAYIKRGNPPFTEDVIAYEYKSGLRKYPVWELEGGVKKWIDEMPETVLAEQFPMTPPIYVNDDLVGAFLIQLVLREREIACAEGTSPTQLTVLDEVFPQRFDQCMSAWGSPCEFTKLCHSYVEDPLQEGFSYRKPHHGPEMEQQGDLVDG